MLHVTRKLGDPFLPGWFQLTRYRDKRDALLSYGATHQAATAYARQASMQLLDRQLFRAHDPRELAPAGWYYWDRPPTTTGMFQYIFRLQAARETDRTSDEDNDSDEHDSLDEDETRDEPEPSATAKCLRCAGGLADETTARTTQAPVANTPTPPPLPLPADTTTTGCCTPGCTRRALLARGPCCLSCPGAFGRGHQPCHSPSCGAEHASTSPPPQATLPAPTPIPIPGPTHPQVKPQQQPTQLRPSAPHPSHHEPQTSRAGRRSRSWNHALLAAAAITAPAIREAYADAPRITARRVGRHEQLTLLGGALLASAATSCLPTASSSPLPAPSGDDQHAGDPPLTPDHTTAPTDLYLSETDDDHLDQDDNQSDDDDDDPAPPVAPPPSPSLARPAVT